LPSLEAVLQLIQAYGLWILAPISVIEGPIATVIAAWLAHQGYLNIAAVYLVCVLGDLVGDSLLYGVGRFGAGSLPPRMTAARQIALTEHFRTKGARTLLFGKWTHSAGMAILIASGMARMDFGRYLWFNLLGTLPKTLMFTLIGYFLGATYSLIDTYIYQGSLLLLGLVVLLGGYVLVRHWRRV
jgi:membrane protein DedA with SNARE-associated domain